MRALPHFGTHLRLRFTVIAHVADQHRGSLHRLDRLVIRQRRIAARALHHLAAIAAHHKRGLPAPVHKENGLLAALQDIRQRLLQAAAEKMHIPALQLRAHVHDVHRRQISVTRRLHLGAQRVIRFRRDVELLFLCVKDLRMPQHAPRQREQLVFAALRALPRFQRRRGAAQNHRGIRQARQFHRCVARVIQREAHRHIVQAAGVALLVAAVVLFVDDDQAQFIERQEQRRARADHQIDFAQLHTPPRVIAFIHRQLAMPHRNAIREARGEAPNGLRGQGDFRDEHDRLFALSQHFIHRAQIDFGFAAAGDAVTASDKDEGCRQGSKCG